MRERNWSKYEKYREIMWRSMFKHINNNNPSELREMMEQAKEKAGLNEGVVEIHE
tara:strand:+ start:13565 stop:13729 length:165 start_codon:yes stop_codon:yes gene_type:complete